MNPSAPTRPLYAHQQRALQWASSRSAIALFMEMRLGKTLCAIRWARGRRTTERPQWLVVAPLTTLESTWSDELRLEGYRSEIYAGGKPSCRHGWTLTNYERVVHSPEILARPWTGIILDESTRIKNPSAQVTGLLMEWTRFTFTSHRCILSGLPSPEGWMDLFTQFQFLFGSFMGYSNFWRWRHRFFYQERYTWEPLPGTVAAIKDAVAGLSFQLTRKRAGLGERKIYEQRIVPMQSAQRRIQKEVLRTWATENKSTKWAPVRHLWLMRIAGGHHPEVPHGLIGSNKLKELRALLEGELRGQAVVVWATFLSEIDSIVRTLRSAHIACRIIRGATDRSRRALYVRAFRKGKFRVLVVQQHAGKFGLDLSRADTAVYYSNSPSGEARYQSEDRIVSLNKKRALLYVDLVTKGSTDESMLALLREKKLTPAALRARISRESGTWKS